MYITKSTVCQKVSRGPLHVCICAGVNDFFVVIFEFSKSPKWSSQCTVLVQKGLTGWRGRQRWPTRWSLASATGRGLQESRCHGVMGPYAKSYSISGGYCIAGGQGAQRVHSGTEARKLAGMLESDQRGQSPEIIGHYLIIGCLWTFCTGTWAGFFCSSGFAAPLCQPGFSQQVL